MGITLGTLGDLKAGAFEGKNLKEAWLNGKKIWPVAGSGIIQALNPTVYLPLGGDINDYSGNGNNPTVTIGGTMEYYTAGFNNSPCLDLIDGGKAIRLPEVVKGTSSFVISVCAFNMGSSNTTYNGIMGGVLHGSGNSYLGYAIGMESPGSPDTVPTRFQAYTGSSNQVCNADTDSWITNGWNHLVVVFDYPSGTMDYYVNGKKYGLMDPTNYPLAGPVGYSDRDRTWDGNIWLGRAFYTTIPPLDYWNGYLQEYAYFNRKLTDYELKALFLAYRGNMLPSTSKSPSLDSWATTIPYACTGGTGTTNDNIKPNMVKASETSKITLSKSGNPAIYFSRSISPDMGVTDDLGGWSIKASAIYSGITLPLITKNIFFKSVKNNLDGSGCYLPLSISPWPLLDITFTFTFQGVTQTFIATVTN
nr:MAG TPA: Concanavalin A-like lectin/glucanase superfamily protein [Crassvirales sp.]